MPLCRGVSRRHSATLRDATLRDTTLRDTTPRHHATLLYVCTTLPCETSFSARYSLRLYRICHYQTDGGAQNARATSRFHSDCVTSELSTQMRTWSSYLRSQTHTWQKVNPHSNVGVTESSPHVHTKRLRSPKQMAAATTVTRARKRWHSNLQTMTRRLSQLRSLI